MIWACRDSNDIRPIAHVALVSEIVACRNNRSVRFQTYCVMLSRRDGNNVPPAAHITLSCVIVTSRNDCTICFQPNRVTPACRNRHNIIPIANLTLPSFFPGKTIFTFITACRDKCSIRFHAYCMIYARRNFSFGQITIADLITALKRIAIPSNRLKCLYGRSLIVIRKQAFALLVLRFFGFRHRVAVISSRLICRYCAVVVTCGKQTFTLLVLRFFGLCRRVAVISSRLICRYCAVVILVRQQLFTFLIYGFLRHFLRVSIIFQRFKRRFCVIILSFGQKRRRRRIFVFKPCRLVCAILVFTQIGILGISSRVPPIRFRLHRQLIAALRNRLFCRRIVCQ